MIKVAIADDHPVLLEGLKQVITSSGIAEVLFMTANGKECLQILQMKLPDVLLLDTNLPDYNGIDLCKEICRQWPSIRILAMTIFNEYYIIRKMLDNGAFGYLLKNAMPEEIMQGIETVFHGTHFLSHDVDLLHSNQTNHKNILTRRETDMLRLIVEGYTNVEIAGKLCLGVETVNSYRKNLLCKLQARNTAVLVKIAIENKLI
jgi:DNA-binding NarL/FixJ family response regulator